LSRFTAWNAEKNVAVIAAFTAILLL